MRNYFLGFTELGLHTGEMEAHFAELLGANTSARIFTDIKAELAREPSHAALAALPHCHIDSLPFEPSRQRVNPPSAEADIAGEPGRTTTRVPTLTRL